MPSIRTRRARPRTRPRRRSASSTRRRTPSGAPSAFDRLRVECVLSAAEGAEVGAVVRFLQGAGERHTAVERRVELRARALAELAADVGIGAEFESRANRRCAAGPVCAPSCSTSSTARGIAGQDPRLRAQHDGARPREAESMDRPGGAAPPACCRPTWCSRPRAGKLRLAAGARRGGRGRGRRLRARSTPGRCSRPLTTTRSSAAPILLPDHPSLAPESLGNLFDNTEIEEALLLHVQAHLDADPEELAVPHLSTLVFRYRPDGLTEDEADGWRRGSGARSTSAATRDGRRHQGRRPVAG